MNTLVPAGPDTLFQTGSLTKTYTATAIWRLIDEGTLALDAPVRTSSTMCSAEPRSKSSTQRWRATRA
jgi:hypothetical protein